MVETRTQRHHILLVAYACQPGKGSEESVGWDSAMALVDQGFRVTVFTRAQEAEACRAAADTSDRLAFITHDIPSSAAHWFSRFGKLGVEAGYYWWLRSATERIEQLTRSHEYHSGQHVTYARYWMPSPLRAAHMPWIFGPVGGGESIPTGLKRSLGFSGRVFEAVRDVMRRVAGYSPVLRESVQKAALCLANTAETARQMDALGARTVRIANSAALSQVDLARLASRSSHHASSRANASSELLCIGRLLDWKGFHLALAALAEADLDDAHLTVVGTGPANERLNQLTQRLGIQDQVTFTGLIPRDEVFERMGSCTALVHPSMHESGGYVVLEALASGKPVLCLDAGGPGLFVGPDSGWAVAPGSPNGTITRLADAMKALSSRSSDEIDRDQQHAFDLAQTWSMRNKAAQFAAWHKGLNPDSPRLDPKSIQGGAEDSRRPVSRSSATIHANLAEGG